MPAVTSAFSTRRATVADARAMARVHIDSRAGTMPYLPPQVRPFEQVAEWMEHVVLPAGPGWVAVADGAVVGYAAVEGEVLEALYVVPAHVGQGIGAALLDEVVQQVAGPLRLYVFEANEGARRFYERHGFVVVERRDGSGNMERLPDLVMARSAQGRVTARS